MKESEVISLAEASALFFRRLVDEGVPLDRVSMLVAAFITAQIVGGQAIAPEMPREPWEER